jgi:hypothetical protein
MNDFTAIHSIKCHVDKSPGNSQKLEINNHLINDIAKDITKKDLHADGPPSLSGIQNKSNRAVTRSSANQEVAK